MKVKIKDRNFDRSYLPNKEYFVIGIELYLSDKIMYRILPDDYIYSIVEDSEKFDIVDDSLPLNWIFYKWNNNFYELTPKVWTTNNFWENFYDGSEIEVKIYFDELLKMYPDIDIKTPYEKLINTKEEK